MTVEKKNGGWQFQGGQFAIFVCATSRRGVLELGMSFYGRLKYRFSCGAEFCRWHSRWHTGYADERLCLSRDECNWYLRDEDRGGGESGCYKLSCRHGVPEGIRSGDSGWHSLN